MASYTAKVHKNGPNELVVESGGKITINAGGYIVDETGLVPTINYFSTTAATMSHAERLAFNKVLDALNAIGCIAVHS